MENFDDLMRHKYDNDDPSGRFEFREEYWEQAKALIEADEARRRIKLRRKLWWTLACTLLLCTSVGLWWTTHERQTADSRQQTEDRGPSSGMTAAQKNPSSTRNQPAIDSIYQAAESATIKNTSVAITPKSNENQLITSEKNNLKPLSQNQAIASSKNTSHKNNSKKPRNTTETILRAGNQAEPKGVPIETPDLAKAGTPGALKSPATQATTSDALNAAVVAPPATPSNSDKGVTNNEATDLQQPVDDSAKKIDNLLQQILCLPLPFPPATLAKTGVVKAPAKATVPMASQTKPASDQRFSFGVSGAASAFQSSPDLRWLGFSGGIFGAYQWNKQWSVSLGLGMRYLPGSWLDSSGVELTESKRYSFGFTATNSERRAAGLLSLEIPIAGAWHHGSLALMAGFAPGRLLYALERYKETAETSFKPKNTVKNRLEKGDTSPFGQTYINAFAGAEWRLTRNTSLSLRGNYRFGNIVKGMVEDPAVPGGLSLDVGLRLKLF